MVPRLAVYGLSSTLLASGVVYSALNTRPNFYAAAVALGRSSGALMVLANFALFNTILFGIGLKKIFFGQLRAIEYEHLFERLWIFLTESLLALTIFRDDFSAPFAFMYGLLLFLKCFHWITADRVDYMDQIPPPGPPTLYHIRITSIILLLAIFDFALVSYSLEAILSEGVSAMVLFASEFTILNASILGTAARYTVGLVDLRRARGRADAPPWEEKSMWLFYVDLTVDFMKLLTYLSFFLVILLHYGLPLHILRDVYMTLRSFVSRCGDLIRYRRATRDMDALYPDATEEEMERGGDRTCIICREEMIPRAVAEQEGNTGSGDGGGPNETPKKLACGHIFHFHCLRSWLERQQSCPTCRRDVLHTPAPAPGRAAAQRNAAPVNPPPAQPGAVPQPPQQQNRDNIQQAYNEYFQLPRMGWDNPVPNAPGIPTVASPQAGVSENAARREDSVDERLQRGIWGGPIVPGRFFPAPLGAAPRYQQSSPNAGPSSNPMGTYRPSPLSTNQPDNPNRAPPISRRESHLSVPATPQLSGHVTPFSSNPPVVFSPTGTARPVPKVEGNEDDGDEVEEVVEDESAVRRKAAEAALRRFGGLSSALSGEKGKGKAKVVEPEIEVEKNVELDDWETLPTVHPRLIPSSSDLLSGHRRPMSTDATVSAGDLDERIQVLRKVDETIWDLVGELTRLQSSWQGHREESSIDLPGGSRAGIDRPRIEIPDEDE
ncbi:hypothetical protein I302_101843 [Kwoniella bestiolae CBS 10118]|uniref:RING-type E3 ubiquitin transferase n=1 Tax=Kwoniella bestiolae CBS 10118 TaxID=1296100 RepID=A0A1B9GDD9_9TREE|nr:hypothetical protein I302_00522 [Kwoniella bestiolae CBS 10118]OCF29031.1 hypothetical protein I302_00522 [Kwoniella bestiolae CBS 10118]